MPKLYEHSNGNVEIELNLSNYATKTDLKGATTDTGTSILVSKTDLACLKIKVDNLDVDKLRTVPADSNKLRNVVHSDVLKKTVYDRLVIKVNAIDTKIPITNELVTKTLCDSNKQGLE